MRELTFFCLFVATFSSKRLSRDPASEQLMNYKKSIKKHSTIQTSFGAPVGDITSSLPVETKGPILIQDSVASEAIASFVRERISPRNGAAKGAGAFGFFEVTKDITEYTKAVVFERKGRKTKVAVRFTVLGSDPGTADTVRNPHGLSVKFYTEDGCLDMLAASNPVFFVRDTMTMFHFSHSRGRNPVTNLKDSDMIWDLNTVYPECMYQILDRAKELGIPDGFRHMNAFSLNTYKMVNNKGRAVYFRFKWTTRQGEKGLTSEQAARIRISDPDYAIRDLYNAIARGNFPSFTLHIQVMTFKQAERYKYNPFDTARPWPDGKYPWIEVGKLVLNENPGNYFADVEQIAFSPGHMIPGIEPSPDRILHGRILAYPAAHRHRLGKNYLELPINRPFKKNGVNSYPQDGCGSYFIREGPSNYYPNGQSAALHTIEVSGDVARYNSSANDDTLDLAVSFWNSQSEQEKDAVVSNLISELKDASATTQKRAINMFKQVAPDLALKTKRALQTNLIMA